MEDGPDDALRARRGGQGALVPVEVGEVFWQHGLDVQRTERGGLTSKRSRDDIRSSWGGKREVKVLSCRLQGADFWCCTDLQECIYCCPEHLPHSPGLAGAVQG